MAGKYLIALLSVLSFTQVVKGGVDGVFPDGGQHAISGNVYIVDSKTLFFENFNYDGTAPGAYLYSYAPGVPVDRLGGGTNIPVQPPYGQSGGRYPGALRGSSFRDESFNVTLPDSLDVCDISTLTVWCEPFKVIFDRLEFPDDLFTSREPCVVKNPGGPGAMAPEFDNCKVLHDTLQVSWRVDNDNSQVRFRLCGCASPDPNVIQYLGFGLSGSTTQTLMFEADATIAWVDANGMGQAIDYYLSNYVQCRNGEGACPDTVDTTAGGCTNDVCVVSGSVAEGQQCITFIRPFAPTDAGTCDRAIDPNNQNQYIVWGVGSLGETAFQHHTRAQMSDAPIHLARTPMDECANVALTCQQCATFPLQQLVHRTDATFLVEIGPSANPRGYTGLTGLPGWGISWFINGTLIPELVVERGRTYTFLVHGGNNVNDGSNYHPFYITSSQNGGRLLNTAEQRASETTFAGFNDMDEVTAIGPLCEFTETMSSEAIRQTCGAYLDYIASLEKTCPQPGEPGVLTWTPDQNTPDIVYYQCASHRNLGHVIQVVNPNDPVPPVIAPAGFRNATTVTATVAPGSSPARPTTTASKMCPATTAASRINAASFLLTLALLGTLTLFF